MTDDRKNQDQSPALAAARSAARRLETDPDLAVRDRLIALALEEGDSAVDIAAALGVTRQAVYAARDRLLVGGSASSASAETAAALERYTDASRFEQLVWVLLHDLDPTLRPLGGTGDRARDAAGGLGSYDTTIVSISLERDWVRKIRRELDRIHTYGHQPDRVFAITNRRVTRKAEDKLEAEAASRGLILRVLGQEWLVAKLMHPAYGQLRRDFLGLEPPRPPVFLSAVDFGARRSTRPDRSSVPLIGRETLLDRCRETLKRYGWLVLAGPGGVGKTRIALELARSAPAAEAWWFLDDATPFESIALAELAATPETVVVFDNAHRRGDLRAVLAVLSRREPKPKVVFTVRNGRDEMLADAISSSWLGTDEPEVVEQVTPLPRSDVAKLLRNPPFEIRYEGMVRSIVFLSEGNPLVAILAGQLAREGKSLPELTSHEVLRQHVSVLVTSATAATSDTRQLREVLAIVAAVGEFDVADGELLDSASQLVGFPASALRRWLDDLADRGLLFERDARYRIAPDLLSEHVLASSFFPDDWRPLLSYDEVVNALGPRYFHDLIKALGGLSAGTLNEDHPRLETLRQGLFQRAREAPLKSVSPLVRDLAPGVEGVAADLLAVLVQRIERSPKQLSAEVADTLIDATQRLPENFATSWRLLLRIAAVAAPGEVFNKAAEAMGNTYKRIPIDISSDDGRVLAGVQHTMVEVTLGYAAGARTRAGTDYALAAASRAMLKTIVETTEQAADDPRKYQMRAGAVPASRFTKRALRTGIDLWASTLLHVDPAAQLQQIDALLSLARNAAGFSGPFGVTLDDEARHMVNAALAVADRRLIVCFEQLPVAVRAEALRYLLLRAEDFGRLPADEHNRHSRVSPPALDEDLEEYILLFHPHDVQPPDERDTWQAEQEKRAARATVVAARLVASDDWRDRLERWAEFEAAATELFERSSQNAALSMVLHRVVVADSTRGIEVIDELVRSRSPLRAQIAAAVNALVVSQAATAEDLDRWLSGDPVSRAALASGVAGIDTRLARSTLIRLADDPEPSVRAAVLDSLRYGTRLENWRLDLGLRLAGEVADIEALHTVLLVLELSAEGSSSGAVQLSAAQLAAARLALLATASVKRVQGHALVDTLSLLERHGAESTMAWVWARAGWLDSVDSRAWDIDLMPDELHQRIHDRATGADLERALEVLRSAPKSSLAVEAVATLIGWINPQSPEITAEILRCWGTDEHWKAYRLLRLPLGWEQLAERVSSLVRALGDEAPVGELVHEMLPTFWSGSRVPHLEAALQHVEEWRNSDDPALVDAGTRAVNMLQDLISSEKRRDATEDEAEQYA